MGKPTQVKRVAGLCSIAAVLTGLGIVGVEVSDIDIVEELIQHTITTYNNSDSVLDAIVSGTVVLVALGYLWKSRS